MIDSFVIDLAMQMGINVSTFSVVEGRRIGCNDIHLLNLASGNQIVSTLVHQSELDRLLEGSYSERLEIKIRSALSKLQLMVTA
jgi:hypothetical protein